MCLILLISVKTSDPHGILTSQSSW